MWFSWIVCEQWQHSTVKHTKFAAKQTFTDLLGMKLQLITLSKVNSDYEKADMKWSSDA